MATKPIFKAWKKRSKAYRDLSFNNKNKSSFSTKVPNRTWLRDTP